MMNSPVRIGLLLVGLNLIFGSESLPAATPKSNEVDVCVYGGTSGGVVAAVQAARKGKKALIVEPGRHLGGMMAGGLSWTDIGSADRAECFGGLAREVFVRIGKKYGQDPAAVFAITAPEIAGRSKKSVDFLRPPSLAFEPKVAEQVFTELAREAGVQIQLNGRIQSAQKEGTRIMRIVLESGDSVAAKVFIDATYEGDLMAKAGVSYAVGRESNAQYGEVGNGVRGPKNGPSNGRFTVSVDPFIKPGDAASGLLPLIVGSAPEPLGSADKHIQSYNYRLCLTDDAANRMPIAPPKDYNPAQWELLARYITAQTKSGAKLTLRSFCKYDPLPNHKYDFNNRWPISTDLLGGADGWPEGSFAERERIAQAHEDYLRGFFHFLATDPRVPQNVRDETSRFGLPLDEFPDHHHWPHQVYVREARRMVSDLVMTEHYIKNERIAPSPVAIATYPMDIHAVRRVFQDGILYNEGFGEGSGKPAPVGYGAIVPKASECGNLFVTFALSSSHAAFGSIRMEPVFMVLNQSAATAACMAIDDHVPVQRVAYAKLQPKLLHDGQVLQWPVKQSAESAKGDVITVDDTEGDYTGDWVTSSKQNAMIGTSYHHDNHSGQGQKTARFTAMITKSGDYEVRLLYVATNNRATNVPVTITCADGEKTVVLNQQEEALVNGVPRPLGTFRFEAGKAGTVTVSNNEANGFVIVDGVQWVSMAIANAERSGKKASSLPPAVITKNGWATATALSPLAKVAKTPSGKSVPDAEPVRLAQSAKPADVNGKSFDLVVVGGTGSGIACAVRAAREGCKVLLVQHNQHLGGMMANGLMQWDALYGGHRAPLFTELLENIERHYVATFGKDSADHQRMRFTHEHYPMGWAEPHVAEREFNRLVTAEKNITVLLSHYAAEVDRDVALLRGITLREYGGTNDIYVTSAMFADATYEGDLAALAKVPYRVGREARAEFNEPHAGVVFCNIGKGPAPQDAVNGKLNLHPYSSKQGDIDPTSPFTADGAVQAYNYRFCVTKDPAHRIALTSPPPGYNREEFLHFDRKSIATNPGPNLKSHMNSPILPGENHAYPDADWAARERIIGRHKNFALGLMWFLQHDESLSAKQREGYGEWGLPNDEFADNGHVPYEMYVREARRIVGRYVYTEQDNSLTQGIARTPIMPDSIAITDWYMDSHSCTTNSRPGYHYDGKLILTEESRPGQIPYRSLLPQGVDNLLVPVCLSATHVAWGAVRLEPVWMETGEATGVAAGLCLKHKTSPAELNPELLVRELCARRFMVSFFNDLNIRDTNPATPIAEYFATRGFFHDYNARLNEPLKLATAKIWANAISNLGSDSKSATTLAQAVASAELSEDITTGAQFASMLPPNHQPKATLESQKFTRGDALQILWMTLPQK